MGLRGNPFCALGPGVVARVAVLPRWLEDRLGGGAHLQVIGEAGRGKSTLLLAMARRGEASGKAVGYEYLPPGVHRYRTSVAGLEWFLLDEADRLAHSAWRRLLRAVRGGSTRLIIGAHSDQSARFVKPGMELETFLLDQPVEAGFLGEVLERRLGLAALPGCEPPRFASDALSWLAGRFGSDLRSLEDFLYFVFQERGDSVITAARLEEIARARE